MEHERGFIIARLLLVALIIGALLVACSPATMAPTLENDKLAEIVARGTLVIAIDANYPPFSRLDLNTIRPQDTRCTASQYTVNQFSGFDVATGVEIARRLGVEPCFVTPQWSQIIAGNWANNWDISIGSMTITYERMEILDFTQPYYATSAHIFVHRDNTTYQQPEDLNGKRIGVCSGCTYESYLRGVLGLPVSQVNFRIQNPNIIAYENEAPAIDDLASANLDAIITQISSGLNAINAGKPIRMLDEPLFYAYAAAAIDKKNSRDTARFVNRMSVIIREMHQDGTLSSFSMQWLGIDLTTEAAKFDIDALTRSP